MKMTSGILIILVLLLIAVYQSYGQKPNDNKIQALLTNKGYSYRHATYWTKVARLESANYKSKLCKEHNNPWGMSFANFKRETTQLYPVYHNGKKTRFAGYKTLDLGLADIGYYLDHEKFPKDFKDLMEFCKYLKAHHYYEEPLENYYASIKSI